MSASYTDIFGKPISKDDVRLAIQALENRRSITAMVMHRNTRFGVAKAGRVMNLLAAAGVLTAKNGVAGYRYVILRGEPAVNAALRELKKAKR